MSRPAPASPSSFAQRLYDQALLCIFAYLPWRDTCSAALSCRAWLESACKERSHGLPLRCADANQLGAVFLSRFRHHITELDLCALSPVSFALLQQVRAAIPALRALAYPADLDVDAEEGEDDCPKRRGKKYVAAAPELFAAQIQQLRVHMHVTPDNVAICQKRVLALMALVPTLRCLQLQFCGGASKGPLADLSFAPLQALPSLTTLVLRVGPPRLAPVSLTAEQFAEIRGIVSLRSFSLNDGALERVDLERLCAPAHRDSGLEHIDLRNTDIDVLCALALQHVPSLTHLASAWIDDRVFRIVRERMLLPRLRLLSVRVRRAHIHRAQYRAHLCEALRFWPHLTELQLWYEPNLAQLLSCVPQLRKLALHDIDVWHEDPTDMFASVPLLEELRVVDSPTVLSRLLLDELRDHLPCLKRLHLERACLLSDEMRGQLQPPSLLLPSLQYFNYVPTGKAQKSVPFRRVRVV